LVDNLLQADINKRLGSKCIAEGTNATLSKQKTAKLNLNLNKLNGSREVRAHPWFHQHEFDFYQIESKAFPAPFAPRGGARSESAQLLGVSNEDPHLKEFPGEFPDLLTEFGTDVSAVSAALW